MNKTNDKSFILKPSTIESAGIGVFVIHDIDKDTYLDIFTEEFEDNLVDKNDIPEELRIFCLDQTNGKMICPKQFNHLEIGNYLNHSIAKQNIFYKPNEGYFAKRNIKKGEELFANYQELGEPEDSWEDYYRL